MRGNQLYMVKPKPGHEFEYTQPFSQITSVQVTLFPLSLLTTVLSQGLGMCYTSKYFSQRVSDVPQLVFRRLAD